VATRVYFEEGKSSVFAAAIDWPGWCRRAKSRTRRSRRCSTTKVATPRSLYAFQARHIRSRRRVPVTPPRTSCSGQGHAVGR